MSLEELSIMGQEGYDFVLKWHEQTNIIDKHIEIIKSVYQESLRNKN